MTDLLIRVSDIIALTEDAFKGIVYLYVSPITSPSNQGMQVDDRKPRIGT